MFVTMLIVLFFGMIIISLRGALVPEVLDDEPDDYYYSKNSERRLIKEQSMHQESVSDRPLSPASKGPSSIASFPSSAGRNVYTEEPSQSVAEVTMKKRGSDKFIDNDDDVDSGPLVICGDLVC